MNDVTVIVTGANGFIGRHLVRHFRAKGWNVRALVHHPPVEKQNGVEYVDYDIAEPPDESVFKGARYLVHCAYARHSETRNSDSANVDGTRRLLAPCRRHGIKPLYLSSFSAHDGAESHYGRNKHRIESMFDPSHDLVLRPGLVMGRDGLFGNMVKTIASHRFVPLVGSGEQTVQTVAVDDLCLIMARGLERDISGTYKIADPVALTLRDLYGLIAAHLGKNVVFVPVPTWIVLWACRVAEAARIRLPVSSDSVLGLKHLRTFDTTVDLGFFGVTLKTVRESLQSLA